MSIIDFASSRTFFQKRASFLYKQFPIVQPNKFVWHLTRKSTEVRSSILKYGLLPEKSRWGLVFVNNQIVEPRKLWPLPIDKWEVDHELPSIKERGLYDLMCDDYDFWRIDTNQIPYIKWKIDPNLLEEIKTYYDHHDSTSSYYWDYICTDCIIPPHCLQLFHSKKYKVKSRIEEIERSIYRSEKNFENVDLTPSKRLHNQFCWLKQIDIQKNSYE
ncbi:MAG: hypothetical protein ACK4V4_08205 [Sphingobacteriales bacterium]|jgi:hypothetical protein